MSLPSNIYYIRTAYSRSAGPWVTLDHASDGIKGESINGQDNQRWRVQYTGDGDNYTIQNWEFHKAKGSYAHSDAEDPGNDVVGGDTQNWSITKFEGSSQYYISIPDGAANWELGNSHKLSLADQAEGKVYQLFEFTTSQY